MSQDPDFQVAGDDQGWSKDRINSDIFTTNRYQDSGDSAEEPTTEDLKDLAEAQPNPNAFTTQQCITAACGIAANNLRNTSYGRSAKSIAGGHVCMLYNTCMSETPAQMIRVCQQHSQQSKAGVTSATTLFIMDGQGDSVIRNVIRSCGGVLPQFLQDGEEEPPADGSCDSDVIQGTESNDILYGGEDLDSIVPQAKYGMIDQIKDIWRTPIGECGGKIGETQNPCQDDPDSEACCEPIQKKINERVWELRKRYKDMLDDKYDLYNKAYNSNTFLEGHYLYRKGTWIGHIAQFRSKQINLKKLMGEAYLKRCDFNASAYDWGNKIPPDIPMR